MYSRRSPDNVRGIREEILYPMLTHFQKRVVIAVLNGFFNITTPLERLRTPKTVPRNCEYRSSRP